MKRRDVLGAVLLVLGVLLLLDLFNVFEFNLFFDGWWTLLLIIPAILSMSRTGISVGNTVLLVLGVGFLLQEQGWNFKGYLVPAIFIFIGLGILFRR